MRCLYSFSLFTTIAAIAALFLLQVGSATAKHSLSPPVTLASSKMPLQILDDHNFPYGWGLDDELCLQNMMEMIDDNGDKHTACRHHPSAKAVKPVNRVIRNEHTVAQSSSSNKVNKNKRRPGWFVSTDKLLDATNGLE